jgi:hydrogenase/urease accessory protein HupE
MNYLLLLLVFWVNLGFADELRLSYLEMKESKDKHYTLLLKVTSKDNKTLPIKVILPSSCNTIVPKFTYLREDIYLNRWKVYCKEGLEGERIHIEGLESTETKLLLATRLLSSSASILLTPSNPSYHFPKEASILDIVETYTWLGITHILLGFDHLLFVFALLLLVKSMRRLLWTITAFTLAHSLTMAGATLEFITLPQAPVEALIALSILFLAMEIIHEKQGKVGLTSSYPWIIAFVFGLLHGFGFAGALAEIGLPQQDISLALIFFNLGVELGQLMFIVTLVLIWFVLKQLKQEKILNILEIVIVYLIGILSTFWFIERISGF